MPVVNRTVRFGDYWGYLTLPEQAGSPLPGIVVIQEIWGVDAHIEDVTRRLAAAGYAALAPDLFAVGGRRPEALRQPRITEGQAFLSTLLPGAFRDPAMQEAALEKLPETEAMSLRETMTALRESLSKASSFLPALLAAAKFLREGHVDGLGSPPRKVGSVGFCMGGGLSALLASHDPDLAAAAIFYGSSPEPDSLERIRCPVLGSYAGEDPRVNASIPVLSSALEKAGRSFDYKVYPGAGHAFFNDTRGSYDVRAARDAFARLLGFFAQNLG